MAGVTLPPHLPPVLFREGGIGQDIRPRFGQELWSLREAFRELLSHPGVLGPGLLSRQLQRVESRAGPYERYGLPLRRGFSRLNVVATTFRTSSQERYGVPASPALAKSQRQTLLPSSPANCTRRIGSSV